MTRKISALAAAVACAGVCAGPAVASTARTTASQTCAKVSASSVSSVIGYTVPAGVGTSLSAKGTKANDFISGQTLDCAFGSEKSLTALKKTVNLSFEQLSKSVSPAQVKFLVEKTEKTVGAKIKFTSYAGLSGEAFLLTFSEGGLTIESIVDSQGTKLYAATVYGNLASSKLASLVKLAEKL